MNLSFFTKKGAEKQRDYLNVGRDPGPWRVEGPVDGKKFKRYVLVFDKPANY